MKKKTPKTSKSGPLPVLMDQKDIQIEPLSGLEPSKIDVSGKLEKLYVVDERSKDNPMLLNKKPKRFDENILIYKKFKQKPTSAIEMRECQAKLTSDQFSRIEYGPKVLEFGTVNVFSKSVKNFSIRNDLKQFILVEVKQECDEISITPKSQVIPPLSTAGFDVTAYSQTPQFIQQYLSFTINEYSLIKFQCSAEIAPLDVNISSSELHMKFDDYSIEQVAIENITLSNKGTVPAKYNWIQSKSEENSSGASDVFTVSPMSGEIEPGKYVSIEFAFKPGPFFKAEQAFELEVLGCDRNKVVKCSGIIPESKAQFLEKKIDFGVIPVGISKTCPITLKNNGDSPAIFLIENIPTDFVVSPTKGKIGKGETLKITVEIKSPSAKRYDNALHVQVRGGKTLEMPIKAISKVPKVDIDCPQNISFGSIFLGTNSRQIITLKNIGNSIPAVLYLDFSQHPDYFLLAENGEEITENTNGAIIFAPIEKNDVENTDNDDVESISLESTTGSVDNELANVNHRYQITVNPNADLNLALDFRPTQVKNYNFILPIAIAGVPGSNVNFNKRIVAEAIKPRLVLSKQSVDFGKRVLVKPDGKGPIHRETLVFSNEDTKDILWQTGVFANQENATFFMEPKKGVLTPGQKTQVEVFFAPLELKFYQGLIPLYLDNNTNKSYLDLITKGMGAPPTISFDKMEIELPMVPLNVKSTATFFVQNEGYENFEVKFTMPSDKEKAPISLAFPEGKELSTEKTSIPVEISFISSEPLTFTIFIDFFDESGRKFSIPVTGTADNSLLTNYPFFHLKKGQFELQKSDKKGPILEVTQKATSEDGLDHKKQRSSVISLFASSTDNGTTPEDARLKKSYAPTLKRIQNWLNSTVLSSPVDDIAKAVVHSNGVALYDIIAAISGKKAPGKVTKIPTDKSQAATALLRQYSEIINFLSTFGALLNSVDPKYFLKFEDYSRIESYNIEKKQAEGQTNLVKNLSERFFRHKQMESLSTLLFQLIKLFSFTQISPKSFKSIPGIPQNSLTKYDASAFSSNCYSTTECVLLKWLTYHYNENPLFKPKKEVIIADFEESLLDGVVFAAVLVNHIPSCRPKFENIKRGPESAERFAQAIVEVLKENEIFYAVTPADISQANGRDLLLFTAFLYSELPHRIQRQEIVFDGDLLENIKKTIELSNPTKNPVEYKIKLEGSQDFKIATQQVLIPPKTTAALEIEVLQRFRKPIFGKLSLFGVKNNQFKPSTLVFGLKTEYAPSGNGKVLEVESQIYKQKNVDLEVKNPFDKPAQFSITITQSVNQPRNSRTTSLPPAFWCVLDSILLKKNETKKISLQFLPFHLNSVFECNIVFSESNTGEFIHTVRGRSLLPDISETHTILCEEKKSNTQEIVFDAMNPLVNDAKQIIRARGVKKDFMGSKEFKLTITYSSNFFTGPSQITFSSNQIKEKLKIPVTFSPMRPGIYPCLIVIEGDFDYRIIKVEGKARAPGVKGIIEFSVPARQQIVQEIPINNKSDTTWKISAALKGDGFSGLQEIRVPPNRTFKYQLTFAPQKTGKYKGELTLVNMDTLEKYVYTLFGDADYPLASEKFKLNCKARNEMKHVIKVPNMFPIKENARDVTRYNVTIDTPIITGLNANNKDIPFVVDKAAIDYELTIFPRVGGNFVGNVTFTDTASNECIWYLFEMEVERSAAEKQIVVTCNEREKTKVFLPIKNPLDLTVVFNVDIQGENVFGSQQFEVPGNEEKNYELAFEPLSAKEGKVMVTFNNPDAGEFWYDITTKCVEQPPQKLPLLQCEIGKRVEQLISLTNPLDLEISLTVEYDNNRNFRLKDDVVILMAFETKPMKVQYYPSSIDKIEAGTISLHDPKVGTWKFECSGQGFKPTAMEPIILYGQIKRTSSSVVVFVNPFPNGRDVEISLVKEEIGGNYHDFAPTSSSGNEAFALMLKKKRFSLKPFEKMQIPFSFTPMNILEYKTKVIVSIIGQELNWVFPIVGIAEIITNETFFFKCQSRASSEKLITIELISPRNPISSSDNSNSIDEDDQYFHDLIFPQDQKYLKAMKRSLKLKRVATELPTPSIIPPEKNVNITKKLSFVAEFSPLRPFTGNCTLLIKKKNGGVWKYEIQLEATHPEIDDIIEIQSEVGRTERVSFKLTNIFAHATSFQAYFTHNSPLDFQVVPETGILSPYGYEGTQFLISYTANSYGNVSVGTLVVDTDEMFWKFEVRGLLPKYVKPNGKAKVFESALSPSQISKFQNVKAFQKKNLK